METVLLVLVEGEGEVSEMVWRFAVASFSFFRLRRALLFARWIDVSEYDICLIFY